MKTAPFCTLRRRPILISVSSAETAVCAELVRRTTPNKTLAKALIGWALAGLFSLAAAFIYWNEPFPISIPLPYSQCVLFVAGLACWSFAIWYGHMFVGDVGEVPCGSKVGATAVLCGMLRRVSQF